MKVFQARSASQDNATPRNACTRVWLYMYIVAAEVYDYFLNCKGIAFVLSYNNLPGAEPLASAK